MYSLSVDSITFGKYKNKKLADVLKDRSYCRWLLEQEWFHDYEYLFNRIKEYDPKPYFLCTPLGSEHFLDRYQFFNLTPSQDVQLDLTSDEQICYQYYLDTLANLKQRIIARVEDGQDNPFNIKAPVKWLQTFEKDSGLDRVLFKEFLASYELPNITSIVEDIKKEGGIEYKGAKSFLIAKERSETQEQWWSDILKKKYNEDLSIQFYFKDCRFDFLNISTKTIFECKLGLKDFNEEQFKKYNIALEEFRIVYLIGYNCVVHIEAQTIFTTAIDEYRLYLDGIQFMKSPSKFDEMIQDYTITEVEDLITLFGYSKSTTHQ
jgi:hypothetical protein